MHDITGSPLLRRMAGCYIQLETFACTGRSSHFVNRCWAVPKDYADLFDVVVVLWQLLVVHGKTPIPQIVSMLNDILTIQSFTWILIALRSFVRSCSLARRSAWALAMRDFLSSRLLAPPRFIFRFGLKLPSNVKFICRLVGIGKGNDEKTLISGISPWNISQQRSESTRSLELTRTITKSNSPLLLDASKLGWNIMAVLDRLLLSSFLGLSGHDIRFFIKLMDSSYNNCNATIAPPIITR